jgi:hypothetical protein
MDLTITIFSLYFVKILKILSWTVHSYKFQAFYNAHEFFYHIDVDFLQTKVETYRRIFDIK